MGTKGIWILGAMKRDEEPLARGLLARLACLGQDGVAIASKARAGALVEPKSAIEPQPVAQFSSCRAALAVHQALGGKGPTATDVSVGVGGGFALIRSDILAPLKRANPVKAGDAKSTV